MATVSEGEAGTLDELTHERIDRIAAGDLAIVAVARGETVDPDVLEQSADAMAELLADRQLDGPTWTAADVDRVRRLRGLLGADAVSAEARALAAECRLIFGGPRDDRTA